MAPPDQLAKLFEKIEFCIKIWKLVLFANKNRNAPPL